eukprot:4890862-Pyramimonas_sp.AAC.1
MARTTWTKWSGTPKRSKERQSASGETLSKAFAQSRASNTNLPFSSAHVRSSNLRAGKIASAVPRRLSKPNWVAHARPSAPPSFRRLKRMAANIWCPTERSETGR